MDVQQSGPIYADMVQYARFPAQVFTGSPATLQALREGIERNTGRAIGGHQ